MTVCIGQLHPHSHRTGSWWRHQMKTFSALLALGAGNSPVPVNSLHKGRWRGALMFSLICARINGWVNNRGADDLRRCRADYDAIVMFWVCEVGVECHYVFFLLIPFIVFNDVFTYILMSHNMIFIYVIFTSQIMLYLLRSGILHLYRRSLDTLYWCYIGIWCVYV